MVLHAERRSRAQALRRLAQKYGVSRAPDTASRAAVLEMVEATLAAPSLSPEDQAAAREAQAAYEATFTATPSNAAASSATDDAKEWKFCAAQLTYNSLDGDWASKDPGILQHLFDR